MRRLLVTGGAGFIGSNFIRYWLERYPQDRIVNLDALTYAGQRENLAGVPGAPAHRFVHGNIGDRVLVESLLAGEAIDTIVNFAAETHVDRSIPGPAAFIGTNVQGTFALLQAARAVWGARDDVRFLHVSTDEVYGSLAPDAAPFTEQHRYAPNSPYAASKAAADHLVRAWHMTYGLPVLITNCSNNYGPYQFPEKLIPLTILNALQGEPVPVYGDGRQVRDWLYVEDHCSGIDAVLRWGTPGAVYHLGGGNEWCNLDLVRLICERLDALHPAARSYGELITFVTDRPGHDRRYAMDTTRVQRELGWRPAHDFRAALEATIRWYLGHRDWCERVRGAAWRDWYAQQYGKG